MSKIFNQLRLSASARVRKAKSKHVKFFASLTGVLTKKDSAGVESVYEPVAVAGVKRYKALITQAGTAAPTAIILENSLGSISFSRENAGDYLISSSGLFTLNKTAVSISQNVSGDKSLVALQTDVDEITLESIITVTNTDGVLANAILTIEVYPTA